MAITTRQELIEALALIGITGLARAGDLDPLFEGGVSCLSSGIDKYHIKR